MNIPLCFDQISLLITHYNRSQSLERLLKEFSNQGCRFGEVVVSDDCSNTAHIAKLEQLKEVYGFKLVEAAQNKGLGNNINKGQDAVTLPFTLYVQEDFLPMEGFAQHLHDALQLMQADNQLDIARLYAYFPYPNLKPYKNNFYKMVFKNRSLNHLKFYYYSDHPHLRRRSFFNKFGRYPEGFKGDETEYKMALSFLKNEGKGIIYTDYNKLFVHQNLCDEPSTMARTNFTFGKSYVFTILRACYLKLKLLKGHLDLLLPLH